MQRTLGPFQLIALGVGAIVGAGIFVKTGNVAATEAGPAVLISFLIAASICVVAALCYAEFASLIPSSGGAYEYAYHTIGEFFAWIIGWCLIAEYLFAAATVAAAWSSFVVSMLKEFNVHLIPSYLETSHWVLSKGELLETLSYFNLPAGFVVLLIGALVAKGTQLAAGFNNVMLLLKVSAILLFVSIGLSHIDMKNLTPLIPENTGVVGEFGWSGVFKGASSVFFAYIGFDMIATLGQETKNPQRNLPIGMIGSLGISTLIFILVSLVCVGVVPYALLKGDDSVSTVAFEFGLPWVKIFINLAIIAGLTSGILVMLMAQTRILYTMAMDKLVPHRFAKLNAKTRTPLFATATVVFIAFLLAGLFPVDVLSGLVAIGTLFIFAIVCFAILFLRYSKPGLHRPFKVPLFPFLPFIGGSACLYQMFVMDKVIWLQLLVWLAVGLVVYFCYGRKHSRLYHEKYE